MKTITFKVSFSEDTPSEEIIEIGEEIKDKLYNLFEDEYSPLKLQDVTYEISKD